MLASCRFEEPASCPSCRSTVHQKIPGPAGPLSGIEGPAGILPNPTGAHWPLRDVIAGPQRSGPGGGPQPAPGRRRGTASGSLGGGPGPKVAAGQQQP
jgi:hypothetical protein